MRRMLLVSSLLLAFPSLALAQPALPADACGASEPFATCLDRVKNGAIDQARRATLVAIEDDLNGQIARHLSSQPAPGAAATLRDTLGDLFAGLGLGTVSDGDEAVTMSFSPEILRFGPNNKLTVDVVLSQPQLYQPLVQALPEDGRADAESALEDKLGNLEDVTLNLSWSRESERFGRVYKTQRHLIGDLFRGVLAAADTSGPATRALVELIPLLPPGTNFESDSKQSLAARGLTLPADFESKLIGFAKAAGESVNQVGRVLDRSGFFRLADLVNNQPQVFVTASYRDRAELAGPDTFSGTVTYEQGWANLNALRKWAKKKGAASLSPELLTSFLRENELIDADGKPTLALANAPRLSVSLSYNQTSAYRLSLPDVGLDLDLDSTESWVGSLGAGFYLNIDEGGIPQARFDLEAKYEDVDSTMQPSRFVATATFSQRLADGSSAFLGLVWANKPEFLGAVDDELSARVGLKYGLEWGQPGQ